MHQPTSTYRRLSRPTAKKTPLFTALPPEEGAAFEASAQSAAASGTRLWVQRSRESRKETAWFLAGVAAFLAVALTTVHLLT